MCIIPSIYYSGSPGEPRGTMPSPTGHSSPATPGKYRYQNFDVEIRRGPGEKYEVAARNDPSGEAKEEVAFPFDEQKLERRLDKLRIALGSGRTRQVCSDDERPVQVFGRELFDTVFTGTVGALYDRSRDLAEEQGKGLRIRFRFSTPDLVSLPWEFLYDHRRGDYVSLSRNTPVIRYVELPQVIKPLRLTPPLRILCMVAGPHDCAPLDVGTEKDLIEKAVRPLGDRSLVQLEWCEGQTWRHLQQKMREGPWHIFHFIGHGGFNVMADEGYIALASESGNSDPLLAHELARILADNTSLRLVVLNSCEGARSSGLDIFSSTSSILVRRGIQAVVAMQYAITDKAAIEFSRTFYESLATGYPIDAAMAEARKAMSNACRWGVEWGTPVLHMRSPDGMLFSIERSSTMTPPVVPVPTPVSAAAPVPSYKKTADGMRFCTECGNAIRPGETSCSRCHPSVSPAPDIVPAVKQEFPPVHPVDVPSVSVPVITETIPDREPVKYPWGFSLLGIITTLGALFVFIFGTISGTGFTVLPFALGLSGVLLFICGIMMIFRQPKYSHYLLVANFLIAIYALLAMRAQVAASGQADNPSLTLLWFVLFIFPGACVSVFFYPMRFIHKF